MIIEDPVQKKKKLLFSSIVVSLLSFGYGLAIGNSYFLSNYFCSEDKNTNLNIVTNSTLTSSQLKNNDLGCVSAYYQNAFNLLILIGALFSVYTHEYFKVQRSRKLGFSGLIYFVGFLLIAFIKKNLFVGLTGRFLIGIAIGLSNSLMIPFIVDNCSDNYVDLMKMVTPINTTLGIVLSSLVSFLVAGSGYEIVFCVYSSIYFLIGLACFFFRDNYSVKKDDIDNNDTKSISEFIKEDQNKFLVVVFLNFIQQFSMINGVIMYYDSVIKDNNSVKINLSKEIATILMSLVILFSNSVSTFVISRLKKENYLNLFIFSQIFTGLSLIFLAVKFETMLFTYIFLFSFSIGLGPLIWPICATLLKRKHLSVGIKLGNLINFISSIVSLFIFGCFAKSVYRHHVFWLGAVILIFFAVILKIYSKKQ